MERPEEFRRVSGTMLINLLTQSLDQGNQEQANKIAIELSCRLYSPGKDFNELLEGFGYAEVKEEKPKQKIKHMGS